jgi:predicted DNA-binding ribbon-helix-helix protein
MRGFDPRGINAINLQIQNDFPCRHLIFLKEPRPFDGNGDHSFDGSITPGTAMKSSVIKHSIDIDGHKTSISLEDEFWAGLREIAELQRLTVSALTKRIDKERHDCNLSSAIRVFVVKHFKAQAAAIPATPESAAASVVHTGMVSPA